MNGNATFRHQNAAILGVSEVTAPVVVTSKSFDEELAPTLKRLRLPGGLLERVAGVKERRNWGSDLDYHDGAIQAGKDAMAQAGITPDQVGLLINTSVTRDNLEPSVAVRLHHGMNLPPSAMNFDITNACLGFVNGMTLACNMIDAGHIDYALLVDGEDASKVQRATLNRLSEPQITRDEFINEFASLTLGSGAAAAVIGRADKHPEGHRVLGGVTRAGTEHHDLCVGDEKGMFTNAKALLKGGMELALAAWREASSEWDWKSMDRYIMHQVSDVHTNAIVKAVNLIRERVPLTYPFLGNVGPASVPITLAREAEKLERGNRVLCMGIGSGINTSMTEIVW